MNESTVTFFQFTITGEEVITKEAFELHRKNTTLSNFDIPARINELKEELNDLFTDEEQETIDQVSAFHKRDLELYDELRKLVTNPLYLGIRYVSSTYLLRNPGVPDNAFAQSAFQHNPELGGKFEDLNTEWSEFEEKNKNLFDSVKVKQEKQRQLEKQLSDLTEVLQKKSEIIEEYSRVNRQRLSPQNLDHLNTHISNMAKKGWQLKNTQPLLSGYTGSFGHTSKLLDGSGSIYPSGGYGCSFTEGLLLFWEK